MQKKLFKNFFSSLFIWWMLVAAPKKMWFFFKSQNMMSITYMSVYNVYGNISIWSKMTAIQPQVYPPQVVVVNQNTPSNHRPGYAGPASTLLGALQVTGGILVIISQIILTVVRSAAALFGGGFWCGIFVSTYT